MYCLYHQCRNTKGLEDDACSKCLGSVHIFHSPECPKDSNAGQIEPHESAVPEGVVEIEDLSAEVNSETEREKSSDGAADTPGEDDLDVEDLDSDDAEGWLCGRMGIVVLVACYLLHFFLSCLPNSNLPRMKDENIPQTRLSPGSLRSSGALVCPRVASRRRRCATAGAPVRPTP